MGYAVYIITNLKNAKQYVGITKELARRWNRHRRALGETPLLHRAIKKYGFESFAFTHIADAFDKESACDIERMLILQHNTFHPNGYNLTKGGEGGCGAKKGRVLSEETKRKISNSLKGKTSPRKGAILSDETKQKIRAKKLTRDLLKKVKETENVKF